jgi:hypothetical protein
VRITVAGAPVPLPGGGIDAPVTSGPQLDAAGPGGASLWALRGGRVVDLDPAGRDPVAGALGKPGYALRTFAVDQADRLVAGVTTNGRDVYASQTAGDTARRVASGSNFLRPSYDMFGGLWLVDRTARGAKVLYASGDDVREIEVPGVTGAQVTAFSVARDGSRMAVGYAGSPAPAVRVADILRTDEGIVSGAGRSSTFAPGTDASRVVDIGWRDPSTLAILTRTSVESSKVTFVSSDGSPTSPALAEPTVFRGAAQAMVVAPDPALPLRLITPDQRLYTLSSNGQWPRTSSKVVAAAYAR